MAEDIDRRPVAIALMGPTASGKTDLALALADRFPIGLVSADSALVYRGLDIGSAKPDAATLARYPHALVDIRDPDQPFSAGEFRSEALAVMDRLHAEGKVPLLVGGTGLYFRALSRGLATMPEADPAVRDELLAQAQVVGWPAMHAQLAQVDPAAAARIRPSDPQRIQRALEVWRLTGERLSELQVQAGTGRPPWRLLKIALLPSDRSRLHARISQRFQHMLDAGFLDEIDRLRGNPKLHPALPSVRAVGYRQAWAFRDGELDRAGLEKAAVAATRQLAKRQLTWFRSERDAFVVEPFAANPLDELIGRIGLFLRTSAY